MCKYEKNFLFYKKVESFEFFENEYIQLKIKIVCLDELVDDFDMDSIKLDEFKGLVKIYYDDFNEVVVL